MQPERSNGWLGHVRAVLGEVLRSDAREFELAQGSLRLRVKRRIEAIPSAPALPAAPAESAHNPAWLTITAPLTGVFYLAPSPGARTYVELGEWVEAGTVVGLIEAMKVFNEVTVEQSGTVARILVEDGTLVHDGEALMLLDPSGTPPEAPERIRD